MMTSTDSLGLYIHVPFCQRKCPYCAFYSVPAANYSPQRLLDAIIKEIDLYHITEPLETIYIGGGSPTYLPEEVLVGFVLSLRDRFGAVGEFTIECNPAQVTESVLVRLRQLGVNRLSIGAQSFDMEELDTLGRLHGPDEIAAAAGAGRVAGFENIGLDLIFAVPGSSLLSWQTSLEKVIDLDVQHVSAYSLTIEKDTPFEKRWRSGVPGAVGVPRERAMYELACMRLVDAGLDHYEISNFAKPGFQCRHNRRYWRNLPVVGVGPSAAGWYRGQRTTNIADVNGYVEAIEAGQFFYAEQQRPLPEQIAAETAVLNLRTLEGIDLAAYQRQTGFAIEDLFPEAMVRNLATGLLIDTGTHIRLSSVGLSFADTVAADFSVPD
ncbi:MAG: radical SAM family heme chaperone HemW [Planctomycetota bacterium]|jgi:oxygen-independent coproporphyrinogen-3 oxidase